MNLLMISIILTIHDEYRAMLTANAAIVGDISSLASLAERGGSETVDLLI